MGASVFLGASRFCSVDGDFFSEKQTNCYVLSSVS